MELNGKAILITGAASGLGAVTCLAVARAGGVPFLVDRDQTAMDVVQAELAELGVASASFAGDLSDRDVCRNAVKAAVDHFGRLDGLVNCAGITLFHRVENVTDEDWDRTLAIILTAPFVLSQAAMPELIRSRGSIVNVASSGGIKGTPYTVAYSAAKAGLIHMTKCMAMEFIKEPVRINAIAPGGMMTNIVKREDVPTDLDRELISRYSGVRPPVDPIEIANMIVYMISDGSPFLHGSVVSVDGGISAG